MQRQWGVGERPGGAEPRGAAVAPGGGTRSPARTHARPRRTRARPVGGAVSNPTGPAPKTMGYSRARTQTPRAPRRPAPPSAPPAPLSAPDLTPPRRAASQPPPPRQAAAREGGAASRAHQHQPSSGAPARRALRDARCAGLRGRAGGRAPARSRRSLPRAPARPRPAGSTARPRASATAVQSAQAAPSRAPPARPAPNRQSDADAQQVVPVDPSVSWVPLRAFVKLSGQLYKGRTRPRSGPARTAPGGRARAWHALKAAKP